MGIIQIIRGSLGQNDAKGGYGPNRRKPRIWLTEQGIMLEMSELDRFGAIWIDSDTFENLDF